MRPSWTHEKVPPGTSFTAWKTGAVFWCECHHVFNTLPCRAVMTENQLACPIDHGRYPLMWRGYLPLVRESGQSVCVVVQGYSADVVDPIKLGTQVIVSREKGRNRPVVVLPTTTQTPCKFIESKTVNAIDFEFWLLRFWSDGVLAAHFGCRSVRHKRGDHSDTPLSLDADAEIVEQPHQANGNGPIPIRSMLNGLFPKPGK